VHLGFSLRARRRAHEGTEALLLGVEGPGLGDVSLSHADLRIRIPMDMGMDSLNVAAAAAVALYELRSQSGR
jgi:tRNA G18 (ribose-2'-O)-methylase SpoU